MAPATDETPVNETAAEMGDDDLGVLLSLTAMASPNASEARRDDLCREFKRRFCELIISSTRAAGSHPKGDTAKLSTVSLVLAGILPGEDQPGLIQDFDPRRTPFTSAVANWTRQLHQRRLRDALTASLKDNDGPKPTLGHHQSPVSASLPEAPIADKWPDSEVTTAWKKLPLSADAALAALVTAANALEEPSLHQDASLDPEASSFSVFASAATLWRFGGDLSGFHERLSDPLAQGWALTFIDRLELGTHIDASLASGPDAVTDLLIRRDQVQGAVCLLASLLSQPAGDRSECRRLARIIADLAAWDRRFLAQEPSALQAALSRLRPLAARFDASRLRRPLDWWWFGKPPGQS